MYDFTELHRIIVRASPDQVYQAVKELQPSELSPLIYAMLNIRQMPAILAGQGESRSQPAQEKTFLEQLYAGGFIPLIDDAVRREVVFGLIGQFWKLDGGEERGDCRPGGLSSLSGDGLCQGGSQPGHSRFGEHIPALNRNPHLGARR